MKFEKPHFDPTKNSNPGQKRTYTPCQFRTNGASTTDVPALYAPLCEHKSARETHTIITSKVPTAGEINFSHDGSNGHITPLKRIDITFHHTKRYFP